VGLDYNLLLQAEIGPCAEEKILMRKAAPALGLFFLAPLIAEYLLGDLPITLVGALIVLAPLYGGGALLIREIVRRSGRGWPTILTLALAYAILEEAFTTQTLFNPDYLHMHMGLLKPAYIAAFGMGGWWTVFVLTLHTVWSISVSIALVESLVPDRATTPWLKNTGLAVTAVLFTLGAIASTLIEIKQDHYISTRAQFIWSGVAFVAVALLAFMWPKRGQSSHRLPANAPNPWLVGALALAAASIFMAVPNRWAWGAVGIYAALYLIMIGAVAIWSRYADWGAMHRLALAGGAALAYAWHAFLQHPVVGNHSLVVARVGNVIFALALIALLWIAAHKISRAQAQTSGGLEVKTAS
jgi:hypothetical protein